MLRASAVVVAVLIGGGLSACGSDSESDVAAPPVSTAAAVAWKQVDPAEFEKLIKADKGTLINVHVPDEGEIKGTDHHIAYDKIIGDSHLPKDKSDELLIYCRSGNMSAQSGRALTDAGYTNVVELRGGFNAWKASGRTLKG